MGSPPHPHIALLQAPLQAARLCVVCLASSRAHSWFCGCSPCLGSCPLAPAAAQSCTGRTGSGQRFAHTVPTRPRARSSASSECGASSRSVSFVPSLMGTLSFLLPGGLGPVLPVDEKTGQVWDGARWPGLGLSCVGHPALARMPPPVPISDLSPREALGVHTLVPSMPGECLSGVTLLGDCSWGSRKPRSWTLKLPGQWPQA